MPGAVVVMPFNSRYVVRAADDVLWHVKSYAYVHELALGCELSAASSQYVREHLVGVSSDGVALVAARWIDMTAVPLRQIGSDLNLQMASFLGMSTCIARQLYRDRYPGRRIQCLSKSLIRRASLVIERCNVRDSYRQICVAFLRQHRQMIMSHSCLPAVAHGDLIPANVLTIADEFSLVDFEYAHLGCVYCDLGKWFAQGGYLEREPVDQLLSMLEAITEGAHERLDTLAIVGCSLAWWGDYRWVKTAERRGRPEITKYKDSDLQRLVCVDISEKIAALGLTRRVVAARGAGTPA